MSPATHSVEGEPAVDHQGLGVWKATSDDSVGPWEVWSDP